MPIPADPSWCSYCILEKGTPCRDHAGPDGRAAPYSGEDVYVPTDWVLSVVGKRYDTATGPCLCFGYDRRHGFWMRDEATGEERNVSERAIGRTVHEIYA